VQSQQLPMESQVFEDEVFPGPESADHPPEEMPERHDHGKNFSGKDRIKLCAKPFISQVYDLLAKQRFCLRSLSAKHSVHFPRLTCRELSAKRGSRRD